MARLGLAVFAVLLVPSCYLAHERPADCASARVPLGLAQSAFVELMQFERVHDAWVFWGGFYAEPFDSLRRTPSDGHVLVLEDPPCFVIGPGISTRTGQDAGDLTLSVDGRAPVVAHFHPASPLTSAPYGDAGGDEPPLAAGTVVSFRGAGAAVPPFEACTLAPERVVPTASNTLTRGAPYVITWEPTTDEQVEVAFSAAAGNVVACPVPASAGRVTIPASITSMLTPGVLEIGLLARNRASVAAGDHEVVVEATLVSFVHPLVE